MGQYLARVCINLGGCYIVVGSPQSRCNVIRTCVLEQTHCSTSHDHSAYYVRNQVYSVQSGEKRMEDHR